MGAPGPRLPLFPMVSRIVQAVADLQLLTASSFFAKETKHERNALPRDQSRARDQQWTVPVGGGIGKIFHLGKLPVNTQISAYYNVVKPDFGPNWQIRAQVAANGNVRRPSSIEM